MKFDLSLYVVTDRRWLNGRLLSDCVEEAVRGGATFVQLREKEMGRNEFLREAVELREICHKMCVPFVVNDDVEIAVLSGADGVHVGQSDMEASAVRDKIGPGAILGVSATTVSEALRAERCGADYIGVGAIFKTGTKSDAADVSPSTLREICDSVKIPVVAIGGITAENVSQLAGTGIAGIAVVGAIFAQMDIYAATTRLRKIVKGLK